MKALRLWNVVLAPLPLVVPAGVADPVIADGEAAPGR
jgi:hypothetical protein